MASLGFFPAVRKRLNSLLLFLIVLLITINLSNGGDITIKPQNGTAIITSTVIQSPKRRFLVTSDSLPLSLLRYTHSTLQTGNNVVGKTEFLIYVKASNCPDGDTPPPSSQIKIRTTENDEGIVTALIIRKGKELDISSSSMVVPTSDFDASWNYTSYWCRRNQKDKEPGGGGQMPDGDRLRPGGDRRLRSQPKSRTATRRRHLQSTPPNVFLPQQKKEDPSSSSACDISVDILYDACFRQVIAAAPIVKVFNVTLDEDSINRFETSDDECTTGFNGSMVVSPAIIEKEGGKKGAVVVQVPPLKGEECTRIVDVGL